MNKIVKDLITYILVAVLIAGIIIVYFSNLASNTILSKTYVTNKLEETGYYKKIYDEIYEDFSNYIMQSGLEEKVLDGVVTVDSIKADTKIILDNFYSGLNLPINKELIRQKLTENINKYVEENDMTIQNQSSIDTFNNLLTLQYDYDMNAHMQQDVEIYRTISSSIKTVNKVKKIGFIMVGIALGLIFVLNIKNLYRIIAVTGIASTFMGSIFLIIIQFINKNIPIEQLYFSNEPLSEALRLLAKENIDMIYNHGIIMLTAGIIAIIIGNLIESKTNIDGQYSSKNKKSHKHRHGHRHHHHHTHINNWKVKILWKPLQIFLEYDIIGLVCKK